MLMTVARAVLPIVLALAPGVPASAQGSTSVRQPDVQPPAVRPAAQPDFALTVTPSRVNVSSDQLRRPRVFTVSNRGRDGLDVVARLANLAAEPDGDLVFRPDAAHSAARWVSLRPDRFWLAGGASMQVRMRVDVPASAEPGEHQVAAIFAVPAPSGGAGLGVSRSIGVPVYLTAPGKVVDAIDVTELRAPGFALRGPLALTATVRNVGTRHRDFVGAGRLRARAAEADVPFPDFTLLRGASREVSASWAHPPSVCVCRVTVAVPSADGTARTATARIVVVSPPAIGAAVVLVLVLLALLIGWLVTRRRNRRHRRPDAVNVPAGAGRT